MPKHERRKRIGILMVIAAVAIPLAIVSTAWACGRLATLKLSRGSARSGTAVTGTGGNYNATSPNPVVIHFRSRSGPVLATARPDQNSAIAFAFTTPRARPGYYSIVATQSLANGTAAAGTPGRAVLRIRAAHGASAKASIVSPWVTPASSGKGPSGGAPAVAHRPVQIPAAALIGGGLAFVLLSGGGVMMLRSARRTRTA
jgi:hypothetical protein